MSSENVKPSDSEKLAILERKRSALLDFLHELQLFEINAEQNLQELQAEQQHSIPLKLAISWEDQRSTSEYIEAANDTDNSSIVDLINSKKYIAFWFVIEPKIDAQEKQSLLKSLGWHTYEDIYKAFAAEVRIFFMTNGVLGLFANQGYFSGMEHIWQQLIAEIDYPIEVFDRSGYEHTNTASF